LLPADLRPTIMPSVAAQLTQIPVGRSIPEILPHAISVSLPTWKDNVAYEEGELGDVMVNGYPRFFVHLSIQKVRALARSRLLPRLGAKGG
jgi:cystathionine gamma-synthase